MSIQNKRVYTEEQRKKRGERSKQWAVDNRDKMRAHWRRWYRENKEEANARKQGRYIAHPKPRRPKEVLKFEAKVRTRKHKYGISHEEYLRMYTEQNGVCASCRQPEHVRDKHGNTRELCVDHCHETGVVRGLLCANCNLALGHLQDDSLRISALAEYIEKAA